jgi:hypothetical protein
MLRDKGTKKISELKTDFKPLRLGRFNNQMLLLLIFGVLYPVRTEVKYLVIINHLSYPYLRMEVSTNCRSSSP